jgi:hypothetical protein
MYSTILYWAVHYVLYYTLLGCTLCTLLGSTLMSKLVKHSYDLFRFGLVQTNQMWSCLGAELIRIIASV